MAHDRGLAGCRRSGDRAVAQPLDYTSGNQRSFLPNSFESVKAQNVGNKYFPAQSRATGSLVISRNDAGEATDDQQKVKGLVSTLKTTS